ncbi:unnamed protein product [Amoebophrya sp. A25]|nr:unnamed protein product [Amoebophrya sp. A25]|eukprot:GSA25T00014145001.1
MASVEDRIKDLPREKLESLFHKSLEKCRDVEARLQQLRTEQEGAKKREGDEEESGATIPEASPSAGIEEAGAEIEKETAALQEEAKKEIAQYRHASASELEELQREHDQANAARERELEEESRVAEARLEELRAEEKRVDEERDDAETLEDCVPAAGPPLSAAEVEAAVADSPELRELVSTARAGAREEAEAVRAIAAQDRGQRERQQRAASVAAAGEAKAGGRDTARTTGNSCIGA